MLKLAALCFVLVASQAEVADELTEAVQGAFIAAHNAAREAVGVDPLTWDKTLSDFAASWGSNCTIRHSKGPYGENLYASSSLSIVNIALAGKAVEAWVSEIQKADPPAWKCVSNMTDTCGHYSQVVWRTTKSVGCAIIHCAVTVPAGFRNLVFCEYTPRGNFINKAPY